MKKLTHHNSTVQKYNGVERDLKLLADSQSLILPNVTLQDAGRYRCLLHAPLGHQNQKGEVHLIVYGEFNDIKTHTCNVVLSHKWNLYVLNVILNGMETCNIHQFAAGIFRLLSTQLSIITYYQVIILFCKQGTINYLMNNCC